MQLDIGRSEAASGNKRDKSNKLRYELIPPEVLDALAEIYTQGAKIHGDRDWEEKPYKWSERFASAERHAWGWFRGQDLDPDNTQMHQAKQALWNWAAIVTYIARGLGTDDRPKRKDLT